MSLTPTLIGLALALALAGPPLVASLGQGDPAAPARLRREVLGQAVVVGLWAGILLIVLYWEGRPLASIGLARPGWFSLGWGLILAGFFVFVFASVAVRLP